MTLKLPLLYASDVKPTDGQKRYLLGIRFRTQPMTVVDLVDENIPQKKKFMLIAPIVATPRMHVYLCSKAFRNATTHYIA